MSLSPTRSKPDFADKRPQKYNYFFYFITFICFFTIILFNLSSDIITGTEISIKTEQGGSNESPCSVSICVSSITPSVRRQDQIDLKPHQIRNGINAAEVMESKKLIVENHPIFAFLYGKFLNVRKKTNGNNDNPAISQNCAKFSSMPTKIKAFYTDICFLFLHIITQYFFRLYYNPKNCPMPKFSFAIYSLSISFSNLSTNR